MKNFIIFFFHKVTVLGSGIVLAGIGLSILLGLRTDASCEALAYCMLACGILNLISDAIDKVQKR